PLPQGVYTQAGRSCVWQRGQRLRAVPHPDTRSHVTQVRQGRGELMKKEWAKEGIQHQGTHKPYVLKGSWR
ncbi:unnamed protein product, partial [Gulo gulo]